MGRALPSDDGTHHAGRRALIWYQNRARPVWIIAARVAEPLGWPAARPSTFMRASAWANQECLWSLEPRGPARPPWSGRWRPAPVPASSATISTPSGVPTPEVTDHMFCGAAWQEATSQTWIARLAARSGSRTDASGCRESRGSRRTGGPPFQRQLPGPLPRERRRFVPRRRDDRRRRNTAPP